jgi:hypothetical protein
MTGLCLVIESDYAYPIRKINTPDALRPRVDFVQRSDDGGKSTKSITVHKRKTPAPLFAG